ncbi:MAG: hypothetical protein KDB23_05490, partial [Planctomycetales bacterium]|nr:hypothetical protein [Planctomycetales bacterium]
MQANHAIGISFFALIMLLLPIILLVMLLRRRVWVIGLVAMAMAFVLVGLFYARVEVRQHAVVPQPVAIT